MYEKPTDEKTSSSSGIEEETRGGGMARRTPVWAWALAAGILAGLVAGLAGEMNYKRFQPKFDLLPNWKNLSPYVKLDHLANEDRTKTPPQEVKNAALAYGVLGALLGLGLGLTGGVARGSARSGLTAAVVGAVLACAAAALISVPVVPIFYRNLDPEKAALMPFLTRGAIWIGVGAFAGLAFGLGHGGTKQMAAGFCGGLIGAVLGAVLFEVVTVMFFPLVRQLELIPTERKLRLLSHLMVAGMTALGAALAVGNMPKQPVSKAQAPDAAG